MNVLETLFLGGLSKHQSLQFLKLYQRITYDNFPRAMKSEIQNLQKYFKLEGYQTPGRMCDLHYYPEGNYLSNILNDYHIDTIKAAIFDLEQSLKE